MRIGIDCRLWNQTGVGRYIRNLVIELSKIDSKNAYILFARTADRKDIEQLANSTWQVVSADIKWHGIAEQLKFPTFLNRFDLDLVHFPYFSVPILYNKPFVMTIHDLIVNKHATGRASTLPFPLYTVKRFGYHKVLGSAIGRAKKIIVPSYAVRNDLMEEYPTIDATKLEVIYEGGFATKNQEPRTKNKKMSGQYLLRVGNYYPHKNVEGLLRAFAFLIQHPTSNIKDLKLVLVGKKDYFYERMEQLVQKLGIGSNILFLDNIGDSELARLYKNAAATIVPSFAEGFSLTAVEAMSVGSPIVASDIPVHREVCADAVIYFDPNNVNIIAERIGFALDLNERSRKELIAQGKKQALKFSWQKMAKETLKVYKSVSS